MPLKTGTIYKVHCQVTGKVYIGRTTMEIDKAMRQNIKFLEAYKRGTHKREQSLFEVMANNDYNVTRLGLVSK